MYRPFIVIVVGFLIGFLGIGAVAFVAGNAEGIHPHGENAVYIEGEACVVNVSEDNEDVIGDLVWCWRKHEEVERQRWERDTQITEQMK